MDDLSLIEETVDDSRVHVGSTADGRRVTQMGSHLLDHGGDGFAPLAPVVLAQQGSGKNRRVPRSEILGGEPISERGPDVSVDVLGSDRLGVASMEPDQELIGFNIGELMQQLKDLGIPDLHELLLTALA